MLWYYCLTGEMNREERDFMLKVMIYESTVFCLEFEGAA